MPEHAEFQGKAEFSGPAGLHQKIVLSVFSNESISHFFLFLTENKVDSFRKEMPCGAVKITPYSSLEGWVLALTLPFACIVTTTPSASVSSHVK